MGTYSEGIKNMHALFLIGLFLAKGIHAEQPNSRRELCVDGEAVLYHLPSGNIKQISFGGCGDENVDYYSSQVEPYLNVGWGDLRRSHSPEHKNILRRIEKMIHKNGKSPASIVELGSEPDVSFNESKRLEADNVSSLTVPAYDSLPGAAVTLYLDFNGHFEAQWGSYSNVDTPPYDIDNAPSTFSATELANIEQIWRYVAEDYAPFKLNVSTVEPPSFANGVAIRVAIGGDGAWTNGTYGGLSYRDSFTTSYGNTVYVFARNLNNGYPRYVGDCSSHEAGHSFGLRHQSLWNGGVKTEYRPGPGDGTVAIMGDHYSGSRSMWWYGTTATATTYQDDGNVIASSTNGFGYRVDDHGNNASEASSLAISNGVFSASGVIGKMSDVSYFSLYTGSGTLGVTVAVPVDYNNLDSRIELRDVNGVLLASANPSADFGATLSHPVLAGKYYLVIANSGLSPNATITNYGSNIGQYLLSGTISPTGTGSPPPAAPSNLGATAISTSQINLTWVDSSNEEDGFRVERSLDGGVWSPLADLGSNVTYYQNTLLSASTQYYYRIAAFNSSGVSSYSNVVSATTPIDTTAPSAAITAPASGTLISGTSVLSANASDNVGVAKVEFYLGSTLVGTDATSPYGISINSSSYANGSYALSAKAYDAAGNTGVSIPVSIAIGEDTISPTVSVATPSAPTVRSTVTLQASAWDNVGVAKAEFYVNGGLVCSDHSAPYTCNWKIPATKNKTYAIQAKVYDAAGNAGVSLTVNVTPN